jgi:hypothetical protein
MKIIIADFIPMVSINWGEEVIFCQEIRVIAQ